MTSHDLILFDGVCNFCNNSINLVIDNDPKGTFKFVPLQSPLGESLKHKYHLSNIDSIVLISQDRAYTKSSAALKIARNMKGLWPILYVFVVLPPFLRNLVYDFIAKNRYKWFGKSESCRIPTPDLKERFLS